MRNKRLTFSPAIRPLANLPQAPQTEVHMEKNNDAKAATVNQLALPKVA